MLFTIITERDPFVRKLIPLQAHVSERERERERERESERERDREKERVNGIK